MLKQREQFPISNTTNHVPEKMNFACLLCASDLQIEIAICTSNSPIQEILKADKDCAVSAPLSSIIKLLKLETDEYRKLSCKALISIGVLSKFFSISGNSRDNLQLVLKGNCTDQSSTIVYVVSLFVLRILDQMFF